MPNPVALVSTASLSPAGGLSTQVSASVYDAGTAAEDSTTAPALALTFQHSAATRSGIIRHSTLELLKAL